MGVYRSSLLDESDAPASDVARSLAKVDPDKTADGAGGVPAPAQSVPITDSRDEAFGPVLAEALEPALTMIDKMAEVCAADQSATAAPEMASSVPAKDAGGDGTETKKQRVASDIRPTPWWHAQIFTLNALDVVRAALGGVDFVRLRHAAVERRIGDVVERLTLAHSAQLLVDAGLAPVLDALERCTERGTPLASEQAAHGAQLAGSLATLQTFLSTTDTLSSARLALLSSRALAASVHHAALGRVSRAYAAVFDALMDPRNAYDAPGTILRRSKNEVATLLGVA